MEKNEKGNELATEESEKIEHHSDIIGDWGPFQSRIFWFTSILYLIAQFQNKAIIFYAPRIDFWCKRPPGFENATAQTCQSYIDPELKCTEWEYDLSFYKSTMVDQFNLVCDRAWLISASHSCFQVGYLISSVVVGIFSDRFGRLTALKLSVLVEIITGTGQALAPNIYFFMVMRTICGIAAYGRYLSGYLLVMEAVGPRHRAKAGACTEIVWSVSALIQPMVYYFVLHFRNMQLMVAAYELVFGITLFWLAESPRWLLTQGHFKEASKVIKSAAKENTKIKQTEEEVEAKLVILKAFVVAEAESRKHETKETLFDLYRSPHLLKVCLLLYCIWFSMTFVNYGMGFNIGDLGGSIFINTIAAAIGSGIARTILVFTVDRFTRRSLLILTFGAGAVAFFLMATLTLTDSSPNYMTAMAFIGSSAIAIMFQMNYLYGTEIFPTSVRQIAVGSCSFIGRFGSISAPFMGQLTAISHVSVTLSIFGSLSAAAASLVYFLPETKGKDIPDTIEQTKRDQSKSEPAAAEESLQRKTSA